MHVLYRTFSHNYTDNIVISSNFVLAARLYKSNYLSTKLKGLLKTDVVTHIKLTSVNLDLVFVVQ